MTLRQTESLLRNLFCKQHPILSLFIYSVIGNNNIKLLKVLEFLQNRQTELPSGAIIQLN